MGEWGVREPCESSADIDGRVDRIVDLLEYGGVAGRIKGRGGGTERKKSDETTISQGEAWGDLLQPVVVDRNGPMAPEIDELRPTKAAVGIRRSRYAQKIKIKNCQSPYIALVREEGGHENYFGKK